MAASALPYLFHFEWLEKLGEGGLGRVDRIRIIASNVPKLPIGSHWAAKRMNGRWVQHPVMGARFEREIGALKRMDHPHVITCEGENLPGGAERFYLMPLYATSLRRYLESGERADWRFAAGWGVHLARTMQYAHELGFKHRDLKPDNILYNPNGPLVIADWGLGYFVHAHSKVLVKLTQAGLGTEYYCSIEQWNTGKGDERADIYSLGMTLDEWVRGSRRAIRVGDGVGGPCVLEVGAGERQFNATLLWMTHPVRDRRPASMGAVATALEAALAA